MNNSIICGIAHCLLIFRCGIPVILMGETGCGKTRLIRFMCNLKAGTFGAQNLILVKVCYFNVFSTIYSIIIFVAINLSIVLTTITVVFIPFAFLFVSS